MCFMVHLMFFFKLLLFYTVLLVETFQHVRYHAADQMKSRRCQENPTGTAGLYLE